MKKTWQYFTIFFFFCLVIKLIQFFGVPWPFSKGYALTLVNIKYKLLLFTTLSALGQDKRFINVHLVGKLSVLLGFSLYANRIPSHQTSICIIYLVIPPHRCWEAAAFHLSLPSSELLCFIVILLNGTKRNVSFDCKNFNICPQIFIFYLYLFTL